MRSIQLRALPLVALLLVALSIASSSFGADVASPAAYRTLVQRFLADYYTQNPTYAGDLGLHEFDSRIEDLSQTAILAEAAALKRWRQEFAAVDPQTLATTDRLDREFVLHEIDTRLLNIEEVRAWARDPDIYSSELTNSAFALIKRDYAPATERLRSLVAREKKMPGMLQEARRNLANPPRIYTEIAIEQIDGNIDFFRSAIVEAFAGVDDKALQAEFKRANDAVIAALEEYKGWLQKDLLPRSNGSYAYGADLYRRKLAAAEMIDAPLERLLKIAEADLRANQAQFTAAARRIDPSRSPREVLEAMQKEHPAPDKLLATTQAELEAIGRFMIEHRIVTIPDAAPATVKETPPFMRATTSASMDTPGPFEKQSMHGYYNMTLPDPAWSPAATEDFMRQWFPELITNVSVHEVWPGHYLQFLYAKQYPTDVRRVFGSNANIEGWAHYCEQMVLDEGFHDGDPRYRLAQLQDALLRDARFIVGIRLHTQGMTIAEAEDFFEREAYQPRPVAVSETKRGTSDALYGYYTMGKLAILKLRGDYQTKRGASYSLQGFHDEFLQLGPLPLPLMREAMLGERGELF
jgi:uncharacterized protein (DUF885 family)